MKTYALALAATLASIAVAPQAIAAADEPQLQRLALCQNSWLESKNDDVRMKRFANFFETRFDQSAEGDAFTPKSPIKVLGHDATRVYPQSVGMGVGFSVLIDAGFTEARANVERQLGKSMTCATSEGVRSCEVELGAKKTVVLMTGQSGAAKTSLVGCFYFYQQ